MAESRKDGKIQLMLQASKANRPRPMNNEKNIFSSMSRLEFFKTNKGGITNKSATAIIVRKPAKPNNAAATRPNKSKPKSHRVYC